MDVEMDKRHKYKSAFNRSGLGALAYKPELIEKILMNYSSVITENLGLTSPLPIIARRLWDRANVNINIFIWWQYDPDQRLLARGML